jgi:hypothetical protein
MADYSMTPARDTGMNHAEAAAARLNVELTRAKQDGRMPTIRAALLAGTPWLDVFGPGGR